jgi:hypothetical protein
MKTATLSIFTLLLVGSAVIAQGQPSTAAATTYAWHAELVSFDQNAKTVTLKAMTVANAADQLKGFKAGDRVLLQWSGFDNTANAVRGVMKYDAAQAAKEQFLLPAELVSPTLDNSDVSIKLRAPDSAAATLKAVKPGEWVTITSKHRPASDADAVVSRPCVRANVGVIFLAGLLRGPASTSASQRETPSPATRRRRSA